MKAWLDNCDGNLRAIVVLFDASREIGLWVEPRVRRRGIGGLFFQNIVAQQNDAPLFGFVEDSNSTGKAMSLILQRSGFSQYVSGRNHVVWRSRSQETTVRFSPTIP
ncbi:hypothetical protein [Roseobacter cerasinus]|uniref:hypothetical protein n=1 Tax=Roseobacter cerasinus TaxID=2602289 RepID=UPI001358029F|nr:hypothetical protein [Roseobacter cerasinus]